MTEVLLPFDIRDPLPGVGTTLLEASAGTGVRHRPGPAVGDAWHAAGA